eukprot:TRINITY_DN11315_c0_g1_i1.p1 TRINITY_DN11315_c0_g1~~TRINITY_DN11315_c0_g1_i1.p1  ORF type:complete len:306 (-),score=56.32 TRINITY_DN11315_c0_g1_i1:3-920(-)
MEDSENVDMNWYDLLGLEESATSSQIKKAYRHKARELHPDKNTKDTPEVAAKKFHLVSKALEILLNDEKRKELDQKLRAKREQRKRKASTDARLSSLAEKLNTKENLYKKQKQEAEKMRARTKAEMEELRQDSKRKREEQEKKNAEKKASLRRKMYDHLSLQSTVKVRWNTDEWVFNQNDIEFIFRKYGEIDHVILSNVKGVALVSFAKCDAGYRCMNDPALIKKFKIQWATGKEPVVKTKGAKNENNIDSETFFVSVPQSPTDSPFPCWPKNKNFEEEHKNLEDTILNKMRLAATKQKQDGGTH